MASRNAERRGAVTRGTGNVFADLGFPDAVERQAKLRLAYALNQVLEERKLSQADAAKVLGVTQPKVSALRHYKLAGFSVERLMNLLTAVDSPSGPASVSIWATASWSIALSMPLYSVYTEMCVRVGPAEGRGQRGETRRLVRRCR